MPSLHNRRAGEFMSFLCFACCLSSHVLEKVFCGAISLSNCTGITETFVLAGKLWEPVHIFKPGSNVLLELRLLSHGHNVNRWCMWLESKITQIACQCSWLRGHRVSDKDGTCSSTSLPSGWLGENFPLLGDRLHFSSCCRGLRLL